MVIKPQKSSKFGNWFRANQLPTEPLPNNITVNSESTKNDTNFQWQYCLLAAFFVSLITALPFAITNLALVKTNTKLAKEVQDLSKKVQPIESSRIIHIQTDDRSDSALTSQDLQPLHCEIAKENYQIGDLRYVVDFADQAKTVSQLAVGSNVSSMCDGRISRRVENIGRYPGTSIILALEQILRLVESARQEGRLEPVLVTLTIHEAEPGPGQPLMNQQGLERMQKLVIALEKENAVLAIIGSQGNLEKNLHKYVDIGPYQRICAAGEIKNCVSQAFRATRKLSI